jgi:prevent-host-death family protein
MSNQWSIAQAKTHLSALVRQACEQHQPQIITHHGQGRVVVVSYDDWLASQPVVGSLVDFMAQSPLAGVELELPDRHEDSAHREVVF